MPCLMACGACRIAAHAAPACPTAACPPSTPTSFQRKPLQRLTAPFIALQVFTAALPEGAQPQPSAELLGGPGFSGEAIEAVSQLIYLIAELDSGHACYACL